MGIPPAAVILIVFLLLLLLRIFPQRPGANLVERDGQRCVGDTEDDRRGADRGNPVFFAVPLMEFLSF
jgi:hypothetical protein